jgi:hypothetical protein
MDKNNFGLKAADEYLKLRGYADDDVICQWFEGNILRDGTFKLASLNSIEQ